MQSPKEVNSERRRKHQLHREIYKNTGVRALLLHPYFYKIQIASEKEHFLLTRVYAFVIIVHRETINRFTFCGKGLERGKNEQKALLISHKEDAV